METLKIKANSEVTLDVNISTEAIVGSYVSLNDVVIRRSQIYNFSVDLGNINTIDQNVLSSSSTFFVSTGDIKPIMKNAIIDCTVKFDGGQKTYSGSKVKINEHMFMAYFHVKLVKA